MIKNKKAIYIAAILIAAIGSSLGVSYSIQFETPEISKIEYSPSISVSDIVMKNNETKVIPVGIDYPQEKSLHITTGVTIPYNESLFEDTGDSKLPLGISAVLDKKTIDLPATASIGSTIRDSVNLKISVSQDTQPGKYRLAVLMFEDNGQGISRYINLEVQK